MEYLQGLDWADVVSRWHPLVLHLPVALYVILFLLEFPSLLRRRASPPEDRTRRLLVRLLVLTAPLAAVSGWLLHEGGGYGDEVDWHEWLGIALAAMSLWVGYTYRKQPARYPLAVCLGFALMIPTAHLGGSLTHGDDFLLAPWFPEEGEAADVATQPDFATVQPVFLARCGKCHGERKQRGGLNLATQALALKGGESGPALLPGQPEASLLMERLLLPLEHDDHMPPSSKSQPTDAERAAIAEWITGLSPGAAQGTTPRAPAHTRAPALPASAPPAAPHRSPAPGDAMEVPTVATASSDDTRSVDPLLAATDALAALSARLVHVERLAPHQPGLWLDFEAATLQPGELAALLTPVREHVVQLSLAGKLLGDIELELLATLPRLERLDLRRLTGPPLNLALLMDHNTLSWLNLSGTTLSPGSVDALQHMAALTTVYLWDSGLTAEQLNNLAAARPTVSIHAASPAVDPAIEVEPPVVFTELDG